MTLARYVRTVSHAAIFWSVNVAAPATAQTSEAERALEAAQTAQRDAERAQAQAELAAKEAAAAADRATAAANRLQALLASKEPKKPTVISDGDRLKRATLPAENYREAYRACDDADGDIASLDYFRRVQPCEHAVLTELGSNVPASRSRRVTGLGTSFTVDSKGTTATFLLGHSWRSRSTRVDDYGPDLKGIEQQRVSDWTAQFGVRANVDKNEKTQASIATFGELDQLTSDFAIIAQFGRTLTTSEPWDRISFTNGLKLLDEKSITTSSWVSNRAMKMRDDVEALCRKDAGAECDGKALIRWIFAAKAPTDDDVAEFTHPDAIKLYNAVFWGPPRDALPRFGWLLRGELSQPKFDYYPFNLTKIADPFAPGETKLVIDAASFPSDFANRITKNDARINWSLSARGFFHASRVRTRNYFKSHLNALMPLSDWTLGTTFVGSIAYVRNDQIAKAFKDVKVCPPVASGQIFTTDQACTTLNIAAPARTDGVVIGVEARQGLDFRIIPPTLLAPRLTYSFDNHEYGLAVPVYFASDDKGVFTGGLRFGHVWNGRNADGSVKKSDTRIGVVFGVKIGLDGNSGID